MQTISAAEGYDGITVTLTVSIDPSTCGLPSLAKQAWIETSNNGDTRQDEYRGAALAALRDALAPARLALEASQLRLTSELLGKDRRALEAANEREAQFYTLIGELQTKLDEATANKPVDVVTKAPAKRGARK